MHYINHYHSPLGTILLAADDTGLTGLWFEARNILPRDLIKKQKKKSSP